MDAPMGDYSEDKLCPVHSGAKSDKVVIRLSHLGKPVCKTFPELYRTQESTDLILTCDEKEEFRAHKIVLSSNSELFQRVLQNLPSGIPTLIFKGVSTEIIKSMIEYMYAGEVILKRDEIRKFMHVLDELRISWDSINPLLGECICTEYFEIESSVENYAPDEPIGFETEIEVVSSEDIENREKISAPIAVEEQAVSLSIRTECNSDTDFFPWDPQRTKAMASPLFSPIRDVTPDRRSSLETPKPTQIVQREDRHEDFYGAYCTSNSNPRYPPVNVQPFGENASQGGLMTLTDYQTMQEAWPKDLTLAAFSGPKPPTGSFSLSSGAFTRPTPPLAVSTPQMSSYSFTTSPSLEIERIPAQAPLIHCQPYRYDTGVGNNYPLYGGTPLESSYGVGTSGALAYQHEDYQGKLIITRAYNHNQQPCSINYLQTGTEPAFQNSVPSACPIFTERYFSPQIVTQNENNFPYKLQPEVPLPGPSSNTNWQGGQVKQEEDA